MTTLCASLWQRPRRDKRNLLDGCIFDLNGSKVNTAKVYSKFLQWTRYYIINTTAQITIITQILLTSVGHYW